MKCLPHSKVKSAKGCILHDSHAEVLAIRGFNRWLVGECAELAKKGLEGDGEWVRWKRRDRKEELGMSFKEGLREAVGLDEPPFELQDNVELHMYCSEAPCGDASMELVMREQEDDRPWNRAPHAPLPEERSTTNREGGDAMLGRGHFDRLGIVRRKPARPDAPVTLSKSCSDKLAVKQCTGLLSGLTAKLLSTERTWLGTLTLPEGRVVDSAVERAFEPTGRIAPLANEGVQQKWRALGYEYKPFQVLKTSKNFEYSKQQHTLETDSEADVTAIPVPSNLATLVTTHDREILVNGVLQGRRQDDPRGTSSFSRRSAWEAVTDLESSITALGVGSGPGNRFSGTYGEAKRLDGRESVKGDVRDLALEGWRRNEGDDEWTLRDAQAV